jgi:endonuclease YncB( thermonuclease family)
MARGLPLRLLVALLAAAPAAAHPRAPAGRAPESTVVLGGERTRVRWIDGDGFRILDGRHAGASARLAGVNALETYGPVHRWGGWTGPELLALARAATGVATSREWACSTIGGRDRYRRLLVACPGAAAELVRRGLAMVFAVDEPAPADLLEMQRGAQGRGTGIWAKGVPAVIVTSLHSADEPGAGQAYDRLVDTRTGEARRRPHATRYAVCEEVCVEAAGGVTCMTHVPFERRRRNRPPCLQTGSPGAPATAPSR